MNKILLLISLSTPLFFNLFSCEEATPSTKALSKMHVEVKENPQEAYPGKGYYKLVRVIDGDTYILRIENKNTRIRLIGINTPELHPVEFFGENAKKYTYNLVNHRWIRLEYDVERYDRYGRTLAYAYLSDGTFINDEIIKNGYARIMTIQPNSKYADTFYESLKKAKKEKLGMWYYD